MNNSYTQSNSTPVTVLDKVVVVVPDFRQWTGTRAMHEGDFALGANGKLPPKEVTKSLGLKAVIDPVTLRDSCSRSRSPPLSFRLPHPPRARYQQLVSSDVRVDPQNVTI